jgi:hypothetical protein
MRKYLRIISNYGIVPFSFVWWATYIIGGLAVRVGVFKNNQKIQYVAKDDWALVLTPLAGSSAIKNVIDSVESVDLRKRGGLRREIKRIYVLTRCHDLRMQSFYNKKIRNPTTVGKTLLLAQFSPMFPDTTPTSFKYWERGLRSSFNKDKHLFTVEQIVAALHLDQNKIRYLNLKEDREFIENLLKVRLNKAINSSDQVASFNPPVRYL